MKKQSGITLIALVITIIVMLILVAVTITMAVNGGLFEYAKKAVDETQNAINAEQKLADERIKVGDKWYASIDDYIKNNPIKQGIEITPAEITLKKKEAAEVEGEEVLTETITASVFGMESEPEITWEKSSDAITLSATTGKSVTVTAVGTENAEITVTVKCTYEGKEYTAQSKVTLEIIKPVITATIEKGAFVEYGVSYTDTYISKEYSTTDGWRLLDYTLNDDGTIKDVKLISTGIPAKLYYYYNDTINSSWYVRTEADLTAFKNVLGGDSNYTFYSGALSSYYGLQASAGMYNNFGDIKFVYGISQYERSKGFYTSITANGTTYNSSTTEEKTGNDLFKVGNNVEKVRLLTLKELNEGVGRTDIDSLSQISETEDSIGLFRLDLLSTVMSGYKYSSEIFWLASAYPNSYVKDGVCVANCVGNLMNSTYSPFGVRPVIILNSNVSFSVSADANETTNITYLKLTPVD